MKYAKALTAFVMVVLTLLLGEEVSATLDTGTVETIIAGLLTGGAVAAIPNDRSRS